MKPRVWIAVIAAPALALALLTLGRPEPPTIVPRSAAAATTGPHLTDP